MKFATVINGMLIVDVIITVAAYALDADGGLAIVAANAAILGAGVYFIPAGTSAKKTVVFNAAAEEVWAVYSDPASQPEWRKDVAKVDMAEGGDKWTETLKRCGVVIEFSVREKIPNKKLVLDIQSPGAFAGEYVAEFEQTADNETKGVFIESVRAQTVAAKLMRFLFFDGEELIAEYAAAAQKEIEKRRNT